MSIVGKILEARDREHASRRKKRADDRRYIEDLVERAQKHAKDAEEATKRASKERGKVVDLAFKTAQDAAAGALKTAQDAAAGVLTSSPTNYKVLVAFVKAARNANRVAQLLAPPENSDDSQDSGDDDWY